MMPDWVSFILILGQANGLLAQDVPNAVTPAGSPSASTLSTVRIPSTTTLPFVVSVDGSCGNGINCLGSEFGNCCSSSGFCGRTSIYCGFGCQRAWGGCDNPPRSGEKVSTDGACGEGVTCQGSPFGECCSAHGYCGDTEAHCGVGCQIEHGGWCRSRNYISLDGTCGNDVSCYQSSFGDCCSQHGFCGSTDAYCGNGCQSEWGICNES